MKVAFEKACTGWMTLTVTQRRHKWHDSMGHISLTYVTFRVRRSRGEMYIGHGRLCVCVSACLSVPYRIPTLLHGPGCNLGEC